MSHSSSTVRAATLDALDTLTLNDRPSSTGVIPYVSE